MSATVDERVVELKFNNQDFEQNAKASISTIDRLKQALNFTASANGLDNVQQAVKRVDMKGLGDAVDSVKMKFSALQIAAASALNNIVNKAVNAGTQIAKSFTIAPITQGFNEYELKMKSIQTILANTQSQTGQVSQDSIKEVNAAAEQAAVKSEELNQQAINNLQKRNEAEVKAIEKSSKAQLKALEKNQKKQSKALAKSQKEAVKQLEARHDSELEKVEEAEERKREALAESQQAQLDSLNEMHEQELAAMEEEAQAELEIIKSGHQEKLDMYNEEYMSKLKAADEDRYNQIKAIDDQIDALQNLTKAEKKAKEESEKQEKLNSLKSLRSKVETEDERMYVEKQISEYEAELEEERNQEARENRIDELEQEKKNINEKFNLTKENLKAEYQENVNNENNIYQNEIDSYNKAQAEKQKAIQETYKKELENLQKRQEEESKALANQQKDEQKALQEKQQNESEALQERQQNESEALQERQTNAREALQERQQNEKEALQERQTAEMEAMNTSHQTALANIESEKSAKLKALNEVAAQEAKPTTLQDVNDALGELNTYADKTIYNFADMTKNIGTFTAAGVDLDTSVSAIKGIANLAAVSGASSQQASTAMYQLSQAIATGTVKLMDWNSVVNAGMGGKTFQNSLIETARVHDIAIDDIIAKNGSFRDSLQEGWLSSDILLETLSKFTGDLTEEQLKSMGYTEEQVADIVKMGQTAVDAATKVRTWTQLLDTTKEAMGSGWATTWEIIFGNFESATKLWTNLSNFIGGIIDKSATERNKMLLDWKNAGGRNAAIQTFINLWKGLESVLTPIQKAFRDIFPKTTGTQLANLTKSLRDFTSKLKLSDTASENLRKTFSGLFSIVDIIGKSFGALFNILSPGGTTIKNLAGGILDLTGKIGEWLTNLDKTLTKNQAFTLGIQGIKNTVSDAFGIVDKFITSIRNWVKEKFTMPDLSFITDFSKGVESGTKPLSGFFDLIKTGFANAAKVLQKVGPTFKNAFKPITDLFKGNMGLDDIVETLTKGALIGAISKFILDLSGVVKSAKNVFKPLKDIGKEIANTFGALQNSINAKALLKIAAAIAVLVGSLYVLSTIPTDKLASALGSITALFGELIGALKLLSSNDAQQVKGVATTMIAMGASVLLLSTAVKQLSGVNTDNMVAAGVAVGALLAELAGIVKILSNNEGKKFKTSALSLIGMAASVLILAEGVKKLAQLKPEELAKGGGAVAAALALIAVLQKATQKGGFKLTNGAGILALAASMLVFQKAVAEFGKMDVNQLKQGGIAVGALIAALTAFEAIAGKASHGFGSSAGTVLIAASLTLLLVPLKELGKMDFNQLKQGLGAVAVALGEFAVAALLMQNTQKSAISITAMAAALLLLTPVLKVLGTMNLPSLGIALAALAGTFGVLGVAALLLEPVAPTLLKLSAAVAILGVGMLGIGAGVAAFAVGLTTLAGSAAAAGVALMTIVNSVIMGVITTISEALPLIIQTLMDLISQLLTALGTNVPEFATSIFNIVSQVLTVLTQYVPQLVAQLMEFLTSVINALAEHMPELVEACVNLFVTFFASLIEALKNIDTQTLEDAVLGIGLFSALMVAMAGLSTLAGPAIKGIAEAAVMIAELTALIAAAGAIAQIPGFTWLIGEGGELLQGVGNAIGKFVGGIIGGFAEGISSSFPQIATDLSNFMNNLKPFIEGTKNIDSESMNAVGSVADMILKLTAADLLNGVKDFFSFGKEGTTFSGFAEELVAFGPKIKQFSNSVKGIDSTAVSAAASAASIMSEVANNLPKSGGLWQDIVGTPKTLETFGKELASFGPSIKSFSNSVSGGVDEGAISSAANAAKIMNEVATNLPKTGGYWQKFFGETLTLTDFGKQLESFGPSIKAYNDSIKGGIDESAISSSANAASAMAGIANNLPKSGGFLQDFFGEQNLETFGSQLESFGASMKAYSDTITDGSGFNADAVTASANAGKALAGLANNLPKEKGAFSFFTGESDISSFGGQLKKFGEAFKGYYDAISGINTSTMSSVIKSVKDMVQLAKDTKDLDTSGLKKFGKNLKKMGTNGIDDFITAFTECEKKVKDAVNTMLGYVTAKVEDKTPDLKNDFKSAGKSAGEGLKSGMESKKDALNQTVGDIVTSVSTAISTKFTSETFSPAGSNAIVGLGNGMTLKEQSVTQTAGRIGQNIATSLTSPLSADNVSAAGGNAMVGIRNGMVSNENDISRSAVRKASDIVQNIRKTVSNGLDYNDFVTIGANVGTGLANGMNSKIQDVTTAATNLANAAATATTSTLQVQSPSKLARKIGQFFGDGLAIGTLDRVKKVASSGEQLGDAAVSPLQAAMDDLTDRLSGDSDYNPVITPTLDLTNVNNGANQIASMFSNGLSLGTSYGMAQMASTGFNTAMGTNTTNEAEDRIESKLDSLIKSNDEDKANVTYNNTFNIQSTDPRMAANEVDRMLQHQVERRRAVWGR